jgi:hypothetical protein
VVNEVTTPQSRHIDVQVHAVFRVAPDSPPQRKPAASPPAETFVGLLFIGGLSYTFLEIRRLTALTERRKVIVKRQEPLAQLACPSGEQTLPNSTSNVKPYAEAFVVDADRGFHDEQYLVFESSWLSRWIEGLDEAA